MQFHFTKHDPKLSWFQQGEFLVVQSFLEGLYLQLDSFLMFLVSNMANEFIVDVMWIGFSLHNHGLCMSNLDFAWSKHCLNYCNMNFLHVVLDVHQIYLLQTFFFTMDKHVAFYTRRVLSWTCNHLKRRLDLTWEFHLWLMSWPCKRESTTNGHLSPEICLIL